jgi:hypothetical protein
MSLIREEQIKDKSDVYIKDIFWWWRDPTIKSEKALLTYQTVRLDRKREQFSEGRNR